MSRYISKDFLQDQRTFHSLCRKIKEFGDIDQSKLNDYIEKTKKRYEKDLEEIYYFKVLSHLKNEMFNRRKLNIEEAIFILINVIDPELEMYKIYELNCNIKEIKEKIKNIFHFYDEELLKLEKIYIEAFCNSDDYDFTKKLSW